MESLGETGESRMKWANSIVENLVDIVEIFEQTFNFCALPLKYAQADGAPVRAVAFVD